MVGNETEGISAELLQQADIVVQIPMSSIIYVPGDPTIVAEQGSASSSAMLVLGALTGLIIVVGWFLFASIKLMARPQSAA